MTNLRLSRPAGLQAGLVLAVLIAGALSLGLVGALLIAPEFQAWWMSPHDAPPWALPVLPFVTLSGTMVVLAAAAVWVAWLDGSPSFGPLLTATFIQVALASLWVPLMLGAAAVWDVPTPYRLWLAMVTAVVLVALSGWTTKRLGKVSRRAQLFFLPFFVWTVYAASINAAVIYLSTGAE
jgi:tryptophan-rich sensory protein